MNIGTVNGHIVGRVLKETVRRAVVIIRNERMIFEATAKESYGGTMDDVFTSADTKAQAVYLRTFSECFPLCGVIGEEDNLKIEPLEGCTAYFTVDPLDGTKAYVRKQSHGVGSMVALVDNGEVISAYVADVNTDEVYGYRPDSDKVFRITKLDAFEQLEPAKRLGTVNNSYCLLRNRMEKLSLETRNAVSCFKNYEVMGSSIGWWYARLWKGEVQALFLEPGWETPWDSTPIFGITKKLGYSYFRPNKDGRGWTEYEPKLITKKEYRDHDTIVIQRDDMRMIGIVTTE